MGEETKAEEDKVWQRDTYGEKVCIPKAYVQQNTVHFQLFYLDLP